MVQCASIAGARIVELGSNQIEAIRASDRGNSFKICSQRGRKPVLVRQLVSPQMSTRGDDPDPRT